jgi:hypothetical protein
VAPAFFGSLPMMSAGFCALRLKAATVPCGSGRPCRICARGNICRETVANSLEAIYTVRPRAKSSAWRTLDLSWLVAPGDASRPQPPDRKGD